MKRPVYSRRAFIEGLGASGVLASVPSWSQPLLAQPNVGNPAVLRGTEFDLNIAPHPINVAGAQGTATLVNGSLPAPTLRWREGDTVTIRVRNELSEDTSIHWHGIVLPANMDGVPGLSFHGIRPGESFSYQFKVRQSGTYWYHTHSGFQEQTGLYGALVIEPQEAEPFAHDRDHVVLLSDWTELDPRRVYSLLKKQSDYFNHNRPTLEKLLRDANERGLRAAMAERAAWGRMRMDPSDLADVSGATYTYLMNGATPADNWTGLFRSGERVRLRFINGSAMSYFDVRIPGLKMTVVAADGQNVHPVTVDEFRIGVAETYDVIVEPSGADAFTIFAQSMDRSGHARGTLAARDGLEAPVPDVDRIAYLTMADTGHGGMDHSMHMMNGTMKEPGPQEHPVGELRNPGVDMQSTTPEPRLDDPGVGLRGNGRRVLTYADLRSLGPDPDGREPGRTIEMHLTGHMGRYMWSFDGVRFSDSEPIALRHGERVRLMLVNDTMMAHPIHLHGLWSDLEDEKGAFQVRKHTVNIPPGTKRTYRVAADALGRWAYHCHLLYHMEAGMFREVRVDA